MPERLVAGRLADHHNVARVDLDERLHTTERLNVSALLSRRRLIALIGPET